MKKNIAIALLLCLVLTLFTGCGKSALVGQPATFEKEGLTVTLTDTFQEQTNTGATAYFFSNDVLVVGLKEEFSNFSNWENTTVEDYAALVLQANEMRADIQNDNGLIYFIYNKTISNRDYTYFATVHKGTEAFWLVQFACLSKDYDTLENAIRQYAASIQIA